MLEHQSLWIGPWLPAARQVPGRADSARAGPFFIRDIRRQDDQTFLGFARWQLGLAGNWWLRWLTPPTIEVFETEDASLLLTLSLYWGFAPRWRVRDADENVVGAIRGITVQDRFGRGLAVIERTEEGIKRIVALDGKEFAQVHASGTDLVLSFAPQEQNPFDRMVVLAAVLSYNGGPLGRN